MAYTSELDLLRQQMEQLKAKHEAIETSLLSRIESLEDRLDQKQKVTPPDQTTNLGHLVHEQAYRLDFLESQIKRRNLVLYNLPEPLREDKRALKEHVVRLINETMRLNINMYEFDSIYRIGKHRKGARRPVIIKMVSEWRKRSILEHKKALYRLKLGLDEDYNLSTIRKRRTLFPIVRKLRDERRGFVELKRDTIFVNGQRYDATKDLQAMDASEVQILAVPTPQKKPIFTLSE